MEIKEFNERMRKILPESEVLEYTDIFTFNPDRLVKKGTTPEYYAGEWRLFDKKYPNIDITKDFMATDYHVIFSRSTRYKSDQELTRMFTIYYHEFKKFLFDTYGFVKGLKITFVNTNGNYFEEVEASNAMAMTISIEKV